MCNSPAIAIDAATINKYTINVDERIMQTSSLATRVGRAVVNFFISMLSAITGCFRSSVKTNYDLDVFLIKEKENIPLNLIQESNLLENKIKSLEEEIKLLQSTAGDLDLSPEGPDTNGPKIVKMDQISEMNAEIQRAWARIDLIEDQIDEIEPMLTAVVKSEFDYEAELAKELDSDEQGVSIDEINSSLEGCSQELKNAVLCNIRFALAPQGAEKAEFKITKVKISEENGLIVLRTEGRKGLKRGKGVMCFPKEFTEYRTSKELLKPLEGRMHLIVKKEITIY